MLKQAGDIIEGCFEEEGALAQTILKLERLTKYFGRFQALDAISLEIHEGEVFALLGPSGCGKTTTLRIVAGLETPDDGIITLRDRPIVSVRDGIIVPTHKRNMGMVFQSYAIWPHMTVFDNVAYPMKIRRVGSKEIRQRVKRVLEMVGLGGLENRQAPLLSGGQQQRVALARALVYEPSMLLLDEPFSNLDAQLRRQMRVQLKLLLKQLKITTVFVTHDQVEALSLSDRIAVMNAGRIEQVGSPRQLYERPEASFVRDFVGSTVLLKSKVGDASSLDRISIHPDAVPGYSFSVLRDSQHSLNEGGEAFVAIRPEDIQLVPSELLAAEAGGLSGTIESLLFVGDRYECRVRLSNGEAIGLHTPRSAVLKEGDVVGLKMPEESITVWPA